MNTSSASLEQRLKKIHAYVGSPFRLMIFAVTISLLITAAILLIFRPANGEVGLLVASICSASISFVIGKFVFSYQEILEEKNKLLVERSADLSSLNQLLNNKNAELDAYARTVAHDLKNPASNIINYSELLKRYLQREQINNSNITETAQAITDGGHSMLKIIDEILLLATLEREEVQVEAIDMNKVVGSVTERLKPLTNAYKGNLVVENKLPTAYGNPVWVAQVWVNYISNALKYGGKPPSIKMGATKVDGGWIQYWVKDNGAGITTEQQAHLFDEFTRLRIDKIDGHGLGLATVKRIVKRLGGDVGVTSDIGKGTTFFFTLPANPI